MRITIGILLLIITQFSFAQDRVAIIDSVVNAMFKSERFNGNILIAEKGNVLYNKSFGIANESTKELLNENSIFELASVSKQFTAMAIVLLKEKGKLSYEDKISKFLPQLSNYKNITIKHLLNHTGGLPDYMDLMDSLFDKSKIATNKDIVDLFAKHNPKILFEPNTRWEYSNTGYAFLASIIEKVSGLSYGNYLQKAIFKPLEMKNTFVYTRRFAPQKISNYAFGYIYSDSLKKYILPDDFEATKLVIWLDGIVGDGTVNSTVNDLLKWDRALYTEKLITNESKKEIFSAVELNNKSKRDYGFGWAISDDETYGKIVNHSGGWPGYKTFIERHIDNDKTIIVLQNHENVSTTKLFAYLKSIIYNKPLPTKKERTEIKLSNEQLQKFVGVFEIQESIEVTVSLKSNQLFVQLTGQNAFPIFAETELSFFLKAVDAQVQFQLNDKQEVTSLVLLQGGNKIKATKKE
ncbi:MAG: serine hydrolase [Chitinophagaceae bacterium]|nr:serine hydrolase [Chitinophagaceae bacterium]MBP9741328.1 serine hydrolase [Chitinophagaceae bacterium]